MIYGGYTCIQELKAFVRTNEIPRLYLENSFIPRYWFIITKTTLDNKVSGTLLLLCIFLLPVVSAFFLEHLWLNYLGETTNETMKWDYVKTLIEDGLLYRIDTRHNNSVYAVPTIFDEMNTPIQFVKLNDGSNVVKVGSDKLKKINGWKDLTNIYDKGLLSNMKLRLMPKNMRKDHI